ncbi:MAG: FlgD immunoglobulin-like domain containing protein, partial [Candidatus Cloacimonetes bacterium]|nr:FlgD immunoglobulin-like domain containing protein [Candidatus Cloacimonadota bacterium]
MKKLIFLTLLLIAILPMLASLAFDEQVPLYEFSNYFLGPQSTVCPNGNQVLLFIQSKQGIRNTYMQLYSPENQALWAEPILIGHRWIFTFSLVVNPDNSIAVGGFAAGDAYKYILNTYDQTGNLIPERSNIVVYRGFCGSSNSCKLISDNLGGFHFSAKGEYQGYYYQHIDALGNLAHPVQGLSLEGAGSSHFQMITTEDHGALLSVPASSTDYAARFKFVKIGSDHQISGSFPIPSLESSPGQLSFIGADLNSFYAVWRSISGSASFVSASRISYAGESLWEVDCASDSSTVNELEAITVNSGGNLIVNYVVRTGYPVFYTSYFHVIDPLGSIMHSQLTDPQQPSSYYKYYRCLVADNAGGWYLVSASNSNTVIMHNIVQHFNSDFTSSPGVVQFADNVASPDHNTLAAQLYGDELRLCYQIDEGNQGGIYAQSVDNQANLGYPVPGACLQVAITDNAYGMKSITLPGGSCLSMWRQGRKPYSYRHQLNYNIVSPEGTCLFPAAQCFLELAAGVYTFRCFPIGDSQVLIVWAMEAGSTFTSRAQLMDLTGAYMWEPEGRLLYTGPGQPFFSMQDEALYMARSANTEVRLHRYVNGIASWQPEGILAATQNPGYLGGFPRIEALTGNRLFWSQNAHESFPEMSFMNIIDAEGNLQYPVEGLPMAHLGSVYFGIKLIRSYWQGDTLIYVMAYYYRVWEYDGGHSSEPSWHYYPRYKFRTINPDGSLEPVSPTAQVVPAGINCLLDDAYYVASGTNIQKYDLECNLLWGVPFNHNTRITNMCALPDGRILITSTGNLTGGSGFLSYYLLLDRDGNLETPGDSQWGVGDTSALIPTEYGAYLISTPYNESNIGQYCGVQYYAVNPINNDDPHMSPPVQLISQNFPNPFKDQTRICLKLDESALATLKVYNIRGQIVKTLCNTDMPKGNSYLDWDGKDEKGKACASGVYILRAQADRKSKTIKIL